MPLSAGGDDLCKRESQSDLLFIRREWRHVRPSFTPGSIFQRIAIPILNKKNIPGTRENIPNPRMPVPASKTDSTSRIPEKATQMYTNQSEDAGYLVIRTRRIISTTDLTSRDAPAPNPSRGNPKNRSLRSNTRAKIVPERRRKRREPSRMRNASVLSCKRDLPGDFLNSFTFFPLSVPTFFVQVNFYKT